LALERISKPTDREEMFRALFILTLVLSSFPAFAVELPKSMVCKDLLAEPAWKDYKACFELPDGDVLNCAMILLSRLPPERLDVARGALIDRIIVLLDENKIPYRRHPTHANELIVDPSLFSDAFPLLTKRLARAQTGEKPVISELVISTAMAEVGGGGFYNQLDRRMGITPAGLAALLKGDPDGFLLIDHELSHGYLSISNSHLNTTLTAMGIIVGKFSSAPTMALMPSGYRGLASFQEFYTYSRQLEALLGAVIKAINLGQISPSGYVDLFDLLTGKSRLEVKTLGEFVFGFASELKAIRKIVAEGRAGVLYDSITREVSFLSPEGKILKLGNLPLSKHEHTALDFWSTKVASQMKPADLIDTDLNKLSAASPEFKLAADGLKQKAEVRFCVLAKVMFERAKLLDSVSNSATAYREATFAGKPPSSAEMVRFLTMTATSLGRGVKKPALIEYERLCRGK